MTAGSPPAPGGPAPGWRPALAPAVVLRYDRRRRADLLILPERVVVLNAHASRVLRLCDGRRDVEDIVRELAVRFPGAPVEEDVPAFLTRVRGRGWLR
ncbi:pyrroloquinoline quinone biosynthesis peptide chaperone PqqD [Streptomyces sp. URMC 123]|uniref:pyrroloquinoline quinone biosynthesis peptide chaperone PqqD n=1 Tax=Streptomyces sp. URMC 123 TaxID=3423403 RepID=UPI003F1C0D6F